MNTTTFLLAGRGRLGRRARKVIRPTSSPLRRILTQRPSEVVSGKHVVTRILDLSPVEITLPAIRCSSLGSRFGLLLVQVGRGTICGDKK